ncbi:MAG: hypothetical protein ABSH51_15400 [Solirubrobacteraceae bacterium]|jgi:hypothetical protein
MAPKPLPPDQIKPLPTTIGIEEGRGGARPHPKGKGPIRSDAAGGDDTSHAGRRA